MELVELMRAPAYHQWLGVELTRVEKGEVEVRLPYRDEFLGDSAGTNIHGGIIASLADIAGCFAVISSVGHDVPTVDFRVDFLRLARPGEDLRAVARTVRAGRTLGTADVEVYSGDRLVATGRGTFVTGVTVR